ncbi:MAG: DMT family transporter [Myxococcales bacterium]|nr:DMT family transporter [Myxococcales bacterium]
MADGSGSARGAAMIAAAAAAWGTWSLFFRPAEARGGVDAPLEVFVVFGVILITTAPLAIRDRPGVRRPLAAWALLGLQGVFDAANALLFFWAMQRTTLAVAVLTHYLAPVLVSLGAPMIVGERVGRRAWAALGSALVGLVVLLEPWRSGGPVLGAGAWLGAGSAVFFACSLLAAKRLGRHFAPTEILAWHMPTALIAILPFVSRGSLSAPPGAWALIGLAGLGPGAIAGVLFIRGLARTPANRAATLLLLEPVVAVIVGVAVFDERLRPAAALGGALVLIAAAAVITER